MESPGGIHVISRSKPYWYARVEWLGTGKWRWSGILHRSSPPAKAERLNIGSLDVELVGVLGGWGE